MEFILIIFGAILIASALLNKLSSKIGVPVLLLFLLGGLAIGWNTDIASNIGASGLVEVVCTVALIFIMFYGGFGTRWASAKPVAVEAGLMATVGVFLTAGLTGVFCHFALGWNWVKSLLLGAVLSSTDAASVFAILRGRRLGLKNRTAPLLEIESGSNDPCAYMVTVLLIAIAGAVGGDGEQVGVWFALRTVFSQLVFGAAFGGGIAWLSVQLLRRVSFSNDGFNTLLVFAIAVLAYALPCMVGGNGYLSTYIVGIVLGNANWEGRKNMAGFFDGVTSLMQLVVFFLLGMMATPSLLPSAALPALAIFGFMLVIGRPAMVFGLLAPMRKYPARQMAFISFVGLRGASSIVFAIATITQVTPGARELVGDAGGDIFSIVFCVVLISILLQGTLIPAAARRLKMIDPTQNVMTTFSDFVQQTEVSFGRFHVEAGSRWDGHCTKELTLPDGMVLVLLMRDGQSVVPKGHTRFQAGDDIIFCTQAFDLGQGYHLSRRVIDPGSRWIGRTIKEYPFRDGMVIVMIERGGETIIPSAKGDDVFEEGDVLYVFRAESDKRLLVVEQENGKEI